MNVRMLGAVVAILAVSIAAVPRITVNDRPLDVAPVSQNGRVLVPMRAIFEALGARLTYDPRVRSVSAQGNGHAVRLQIGNAEAIVDGRVVELDAPARIVAASTYVPLRFVAQSLGAVVGYDNAAALVTVSLQGIRQGPSSAGAGAYGPERVGSMLPAPNTTVASGYPTISAVVGGSVPVGHANLSVDGVDVTDATSFDGTTMTYIPAQGLQTGAHRIALSGADRAGQPFYGTWIFTTTVAPAPSFGGNVPFQFYLDGGGQYGYGQQMSLVLVAPPGGSAYFTTCDSPQRNWMYGSGDYYRGYINAPYGLSDGYCPIEAVYVGWNGQTWYAPFPIIAHLYPHRRYGDDDDYGNGYRQHHPRPTPTPRWPQKPTPSPQPNAPHQPWFPAQATPPPYVAHPPRQPEATPVPRPQTTAQPKPERTPAPTAAPTAAPAPAATPEPKPAQPEAPQPRAPHEPHPKETPPA